MFKCSLFGLVLVAAAIGPLQAAPSRPGNCESLRNLAIENVTVAIAEVEKGSTFTPPYGDPLTKMPEFCRVAGSIHPVADSNTAFEVWLPVTGWNGKFRGTGTGGFAGSIDFRGMGGNVSRRYATAGSNAGHDGDAVDASWLWGTPKRSRTLGIARYTLRLSQPKPSSTPFTAGPTLLLRFMLRRWARGPDGGPALSR